MHPIYLLLRHRLTRWLRDPSWGTGTIAGQAVMLGLLLFLLIPIAGGSYALGSVLRELYPSTDTLRLLNGGLIYLLPILTVSRFLIQSPISERVSTYLALPINRQDLLQGQALLPLISVHSVFALVMVVPLWTAEVWTSLSPVQALAWLGSALLVAVLLPSLGAQGLQILLGRRPRWFVGALAGGAGVVAADAILGSDLFRAASRFVFGAPLAGLISTLAGTGGVYAGLLRLMRERLEIDQHTEPRRGGTPSWSQTVYRWVEQTPAGRLVAMELRQIFRTRRLRGVILYTTLIVIGIHIWGFITVVFLGKPINILYLVLASTTGIGGCAIGLGPLIIGISADHADELFTQPIRLKDIVWGKLTILWLSTGPGAVLLLIACGWMPLRETLLFTGAVFWWWGVIVPGLIWINLHTRNPVDLSASHFSLQNNFHSLTTIFLALSPLVACVAVENTGQWWTVVAGMGLLGLAGICVLIYTTMPLTGKLARHRLKILEGFRENPPI